MSRIFAWGARTARARVGVPVATLAMAMLALAAVSWSGQANGDWMPEARPELRVPQSAAEMQLSFAPLVQYAAPAVVNILTIVNVAGSDLGPSRLFNDPFFREFFQGFPGGPPGPSMPRQELSSLGSGVILTPDGVMVTNYHVIERADAIRVVLADRREFEAEILGVDRATDLAVLRIGIEAESLQYLELGDSDEILVGDLVLAIGNPFGVGQTVTSGIVSALARTEIGVSDYSFFIQTDAPINPGNSGGALVGMDGRVIGINTAIYSESGGSHGIGFAVPANMVRTVVGAVLEHGRVVRPWLGAEMEEVTTELAVVLGLARPYGALLVDIAPNGPAIDAGLRPGDVVLAIEGHDLENTNALRFRVGTYPAGTEVELTVLRDQEVIAVPVTLQDPPSVAAMAQALRLAGPHPLNGASVTDMTADLAAEFALGDLRIGAFVTAVADGTASRQIGLRPGDIVVGINGVEVANVEALEAMLARPQPLWRVSVLRNGVILSVTVRG